jgi:hypothetical protein
MSTEQGCWLSHALAMWLLCEVATIAHAMQRQIMYKYTETEVRRRGRSLFQVNAAAFL